MTSVCEISPDRQVGGGKFPFRFRRQPFSGPSGECIGLIKADMADRLGRIQPAAAG
jgi:hypothetical protein